MTRSRADHYVEAERLIAEGVEVVRRIESLAMNRLSIIMSRPDGEVGALAPYDTARVELLTRQMDDRGKQAMGIWAQAQVHATLAAAASSVEDDVLDRERS